MGAGRKTETIPLQERVQRNPTVKRRETARNLRKNDLGGVIFGCARYTMKECLSNQIFGSPFTHFSYIKNVEPGLPLFLFNHSHRQLLGIYEAASSGEMNINPYGWSEDGQERTQYPAQVRIRIRKQCKSLSENQYRPILEDNYYTEDQFWFELDHAQTGRLISLFGSSPITVPEHPQIAPKQNWASKLPQYSANWNVLRDMNSDLGENKEEGPSSSDSEDVTPWDERTNFELGSSSATPCEDETNENLGPDLDKVEEENEEELVYRKLLQLVNERETENCDSIGGEENVGVSYDLNASSVDFDCEPEVPLFNSDKHEVVLNNSFDTHFSSPTSSDVQSIADHLRQEVEDVKVQQLQENFVNFEMKLINAEIQVQQSTQCVKELESRPISSDASTESLETSSADTMDMEDFLGDNKLVFLFGGYDGVGQLSTVDCYSPLRDTKKPLRPMNLSRSHAAAAALCGDMYVFGGGDGTVWFNTVESYNPQRNEWTSRPSLTHRKGCLSGVTLGNKIYAIGGGDGVSCFSDVEMFDPTAGRWIRTQSMLQKRFSSAVAELNGAIYAAGGYDGEQYLNSVERFDPREVVSWSAVPSMNIQRGCHSLVAMNEKLYAVGGYDGQNMVSSVEEFDPRRNSWIARDEMKEARGYTNAAVIGESIFVISGMTNGKVLTETVECYKEGQGWSVANLKGAEKRCFSAAIVM